MAANYGRTKACDPIWYRSERRLHLSCPCGHRMVIHIGPFAREHRISDKLTLGDLQLRLKCSQCGRKTPNVSVPEGGR